MLTISGVSPGASLTRVTVPLDRSVEVRHGLDRLDHAVRRSRCVSAAPTFGVSTKTMSPSSFCAWSVMPTIASAPSTRTHACSFVVLQIRREIASLASSDCPSRSGRGSTPPLSVTMSSGGNPGPTHDRGEGLPLPVARGRGHAIPLTNRRGGSSPPRAASARHPRAQLARRRLRVARGADRRDHRHAVGTGRDRRRGVRRVDPPDGDDRQPRLRAQPPHAVEADDRDRLGCRRVDRPDRDVVGARRLGAARGPRRCRPRRRPGPRSPSSRRASAGAESPGPT